MGPPVGHNPYGQQQTPTSSVPNGQPVSESSTRRRGQPAGQTTTRESTRDKQSPTPQPVWNLATTHRPTNMGNDSHFCESTSWRTNPLDNQQPVGPPHEKPTNGIAQKD